MLLHGARSYLGGVKVDRACPSWRHPTLLRQMRCMAYMKYASSHMLSAGRYGFPSLGLGTMLRLHAEGVTLTSQVLQRIPGVEVRPNFAKVRIGAPDRIASWGIVRQIAGGEYAHAGFTPRPGDRVIDVGANVGVFSLWAQRHGATVFAYEPSPLTFSFLVTNTRGLTIKPIHAAVVGELASDDRNIRLYLHDERSTRNTLLPIEIEDGTELTQSVLVPACTLSEALAEGCDLLKIDVEGSEYEMLAHTPVDVLRRATRIVIEFHSIAGDPNSVLSSLREAGFDARLLSGELDSVGVIGASRS
jgi:FkbM family methyltransferase